MSKWTWDDRVTFVTAAEHAALADTYLEKYLQEQKEDAPLPNPRFCPTICPVCQLGNIYGQMTCSDIDCPGKRRE